MKLYFISLFILIHICVFDIYAQFDYLPAPVGSNQIIAYTQFTLSYNEQHEQADWVAYELTEAEADMDLDRCDCFKTETRVSTGSATPDDYTQQVAGSSPIASSNSR